MMASRQLTLGGCCSWQQLCCSEPSSCCHHIEAVSSLSEELLVCAALGLQYAFLLLQWNLLRFKNCMLMKIMCASVLHRLASVYLEDIGTEDHSRESHVGLGHLLHSSPKSSTCITRVRKADIPSTLSAIQRKALEPQQT